MITLKLTTSQAMLVEGALLAVAVEDLYTVAPGYCDGQPPAMVRARIIEDGQAILETMKETA